MNVVSNAPEYDKKRPGHKKKSTTTTKKNVTNSQNSINLSPKNPFKKKKKTFFVSRIFWWDKNLSKPAPPLPLCILEPLPHLPSEEPQYISGI